MNLKIDQEAFDEQLRLAQDRLVVVDFYATWCGPCKMLAPFLEELARDIPETVFLKVNVDDVDELAHKYEITGLPTIVYFKNSKAVERLVGANRDKLKALVLKLKQMFVQFVIQ